MKRPAVDWAALLEQYDDHSASSEDGQDLLATLIGDEHIEAAVDYYTSLTALSAETLRMAFKVLQPMAFSLPLERSRTSLTHHG